MSQEFIWRYRSKPDGLLSEPVTVRLSDRAARMVRRLKRTVDETSGEERTAALNEITTIMDLHALFPDAYFSAYPLDP